MLQRSSERVQKLAASILGVRGAGDRWMEWISGASITGPRIWVHGASVGEALVVRPILSHIRARSSKPVIAIHTHTSPSVAEWPGDLGMDRSDFLPAPSRIKQLLESFRPHFILYPRADLWPQMVTAAGRRSIRQIVVGGVLSPATARLRWPALWVNRRTVSYLTAVCAVSDLDVVRWQEMGVSANRIFVTGDPRDDDVLARLDTLEVPAGLRAWADSRFTLVAGSTHPADIPPLLDAVASSETTNLIIVPHEPSPANCARLLAAAQKRSLQSGEWTTRSETPGPAIRVIVAAERGLLAAIYGLGAAAYVGGGFERVGIHSIAEPAAWKIPILVGPRAQKAEHAQRFLRGKGALVIASAAALSSYLSHWASDDLDRRRTGERAHACLYPGAAERTVDVLVRLAE